MSCSQAFKTLGLLSVFTALWYRCAAGEEIHEAAAKGDVEAVAAILKAAPEKVRVKDDEGLKPLHHAAAQGRQEAVKLLLANKAVADAKAKEGSTPLHMAVQVLRITKVSPDEVDKVLAEYAAVTEHLINSGSDVNAKDLYGKTPVAYASNRNFTAIVEVLTRHGAVDWKTSMRKGLDAERNGRYAEAETSYKDALAIAEKTGGPEHPDVAAILHYLANALRKQKKFTEAEPLYTRALNIRAKTFVDRHPDTIATMEEMLKMLGSAGMEDKAKEMEKRVRAAREKAAQEQPNQQNRKG
jgi:ankyrin repeat protein